MFERKTLIVVGAGASFEVGLPVGKELKRRIAELLDIRFEDGYRQATGDRTICDAFRIVVEEDGSPRRDISPYLHVCWRIRNAMPQALSIDNFIDVNQGDDKLELSGKLGIAKAILEAERNSKLYIDARARDPRIDFEAIENTWFTSFLHLLTENCRLEELEHRLSTITAIVFNYDRCLEQFLFHALQNYYPIDAAQTTAILSKLTIYHPYGQVGALPWQNPRQNMPYGADPAAPQLLDVAKQIRTFTEGTDPASSHIGAIRSRFVESQIVMFLGFAFHPLNLDLLSSQDAQHQEPSEVRYFATAKGISDPDCRMIVRDLVRLAGAPEGQISLHNGFTCQQLFQEYRRTLSLARRIRS